MSDDVGFYKLSQLCSRQETKWQKSYEGIFPWGESTIQRMVAKGTFPQPIRGYGRSNLWPKAEIHAFIARMKEEAVS